MKKIIIILTIFFSTISAISAEEVKRIVVGSKDAKITIIAFESLTCSHCANFHKDVYPGLKKDYLDTGLAKIEFRHFPLDVAAFNAAKVSQCKNDGDSKILNTLYANQQKWVKGSSVQEANKNLQKFLTSEGDRKSTRLNSSHGYISYAVFCLKKKNIKNKNKNK